MLDPTSWRHPAGPRYDAILVVLGFVDCNYVAPFKRLRSFTPAEAAGAAGDGISGGGVGGSGSVGDDGGNWHGSGGVLGGGVDDVDTLAAASAHIVDFAQRHWVSPRGRQRPLHSFRTSCSDAGALKRGDPVCFALL